MVKVKAIEYSRTFSSENTEPRKYIGKYEPERISVTLEPENETIEELFSIAFEKVYKFHEKAESYRFNYNDIVDLKSKLDDLESLIEQAPDSKKLQDRKQELLRQINERVA